MPKISGQQGFAHLLILLIIVIGIVVGVILVKNPQIFNSKADYQPTITFLNNEGLVMEQSPSSSVKVQLTYVPPGITYFSFQGQHIGPGLIQDTSVTPCPGQNMSWDQMEKDLHKANYPGPWDHGPKELAAYHRASCRTAPPPKGLTIFTPCESGVTKTWNDMDKELSDRERSNDNTHDAQEILDYQEFVCNFLVGPDKQPSDFPSSFKIANNLDALTNAPEQYFDQNNKVVDWQLDPGEGERTVYVQFKVNNTWMSPISSSILVSFSSSSTPTPTPTPTSSAASAQVQIRYLPATPPPTLSPTPTPIPANRISLSQTSNQSSPSVPSVSSNPVQSISNSQVPSALYTPPVAPASDNLSSNSSFTQSTPSITAPLSSSTSLNIVTSPAPTGVPTVTSSSQPIGSSTPNLPDIPVVSGVLNLIFNANNSLVNLLQNH